MFERAVRAALGKDEDDREDGHRGARATPKVTLPRIAWLEKRISAFEDGDDKWVTDTKEHEIVAWRIDGESGLDAEPIMPILPHHVIPINAWILIKAPDGRFYPTQR
jgi:hypothetical protein